MLLERYGMTEIGMAISCGLDFDDRVDASVGWPLPDVDVRLVDDQGQVIGREDEVGEIQVRGPTLFAEYWANRPATLESFAGGGWFKTGDMAIRKASHDSAGHGKSGSWAIGPMYFIQGRRSVDIIKMAGEKVSALEVERELLAMYVSLFYARGVFRFSSASIHASILYLSTAFIPFLYPSVHANPPSK